MAYVIHVLNQNQWKIDFTGAIFINDKTNLQSKTLQGWVSEYKATIGWNLAFFNFDTAANRAKGCANRVLEYTRDSKGITHSYDGGNLTNERLTLNNGATCGGWKLAVKDGVQKDFDRSTKRTRNFNGLTTDGRYIHAQSTSLVTEKDAIQYIINYISTYYNVKIKLLLVQDAGGSTQFYCSNSKQYVAGEGGRKIPSIVTATYIGPKIERTLKQGCKGWDVTLLQQYLGSILIDGDFGSETKKRLIKVQKAIGTKGDGIAGPTTLRLLGLG